MDETRYVATNPYARPPRSGRTAREWLVDRWHRTDYAVSRWEALRSGAWSYPVKGAECCADHLAAIGFGIDGWACLACGAYDDLGEMNGVDVPCVPALPEKIAFQPPQSRSERASARAATLCRATRVARPCNDYAALFGRDAAVDIMQNSDHIRTSAPSAGF